MSNGSQWGRQLAAAEAEAQRQFPRDPKKQRRHVEYLMGFTSAETQAERREEARQASREMKRRRRRSRFLHKITFGLLGVADA